MVSYKGGRDKMEKKYYRKNVELFLLLDKIKLWPARNGTLHGIREVEKQGKSAVITTHCGKTFRVYNSRNSRAARWLRNKWIVAPCKDCKVPQWKLDKYSRT
jgi:pyrrolysyl-tRNA synthetase-like protein